MARTVTLRLDNDLYSKFKEHAADDNRNLSNFIETATMRFIEEHDFVDEYEMNEIRNNKDLQNSLKRGIRDTRMKRGRFAE